MRTIREKAFVILDCTLLPIDRIAADTPYYSGKHIARRATEAGTDAAGFLRRAAESRAAAELAEGVRQGVHPDDVALCLELDRFPFAVVAALKDLLMVLRPCAVPSLTLTDEASI